MYARWRTAALLGVVLLGLIGLSAALQSRQQSVPLALPSVSQAGTPVPTIGSLAEGELFPTVTMDQIDTISVMRPNQPTLHWQKGAEGWQVADAVGTLSPADPASMVRAITILSTLRYNRELEDVNVGQFGLGGQGQGEINFTAGGAAHRLRVGNSDPYSGAFYMQRDDDPAVYVVSSDLVALLFSSLTLGTPTASATGAATP